MKRTLSLLLFLVLSYILSAQTVDTIKVMTYNTTNYGFPATQSCPTLGPTKHPYMRTIMQYEDPDILGLVKMSGTPSTFTTDTVIQEVLDSVCPGCWGHSPFTSFSGYYKENMLYYKTAKFGFIGTTTIYSADSNISDINLHRLYYKSADLAITHDTVYINIIQCHDKSGNDQSDSAERAADLTGAMAWMDSHVSGPGNYLFMGDLNTQTSTEGAYQALIDASNSYIRFTDPSGQQIGDWSSRPTVYANYLTQSTRTTDPGDCGSLGGMSAIFDHILCTKPVMNGAQSLMYVPDSYTVVGQDGQHTGGAINANPYQYFSACQCDQCSLSDEQPPASDGKTPCFIDRHYPPNGIKPISDLSPSFSCEHLVSSLLHVKATVSGSPESYTATIYDMQGRALSHYSIYTNDITPLGVSDLAEGSYILAIKATGGLVFKQRFMKVCM